MGNIEFKIDSKNDSKIDSKLHSKNDSKFHSKKDSRLHSMFYNMPIMLYTSPWAESSVFQKST
jgi:hypothetical protein